MKKYRAKHDDGSFVLKLAFDKVIESDSYNKVACVIAYYYQEQYIKLCEKINNDYVIVEDDRQNNFYKTLKTEWFYHSDK
jgi:uncharacterized protein YueI